MWRTLSVGAFTFFVVLGVFLFVSGKNSAVPEKSLSHNDIATITIGSTPLSVTLANTFEKRAKGLSGQKELPVDEGMLFAFPEDGIYGFWMKDMLFSLDIIWISAHGTVVYIEKSVAPSTYPTTFTPTVPARYVLEVPAGFSEEHNIFVGSKVRF